MNNRSNSDLQQSIEKVLIERLEKKIGLSNLCNESYLYINDDQHSKILPDIYSSEHHIIGEVYTHIGKLKSAQMDKIMADILKMKVFADNSDVDYKLYYVVCDEDTKKSMLGNGVIAGAVSKYDIQVECFTLDEPLKAELIETMSRQDITVKEVTSPINPPLSFSRGNIM